MWNINVLVQSGLHCLSCVVVVLRLNINILRSTLTFMTTRMMNLALPVSFTCVFFVSLLLVVSCCCRGEWRQSVAFCCPISSGRGHKHLRFHWMLTYVVVEGSDDSQSPSAVPPLRAAGTNICVSIGCWPKSGLLLKCYWVNFISFSVKHAPLSESFSSFYPERVTLQLEKTWNSLP